MTRLLRRSIATRATALVLTAVAATACGGSHAQSAQRADSPASGIDAASHSSDTSSSGQRIANNNNNNNTGTTSVQAPSQQQQRQQQQSTVDPAAANATHASAASSAAPFVWSLRAQVTPECVVAGQTARVTVQTTYNAALAFVAVYAGNKSGAAPPFGYGYGGNDDGYSSRQDGTWADTWTIRADAPRGAAHVIVVAASHQTSKRVNVPFTVVDPLTGSC